MRLNIKLRFWRFTSSLNGSQSSRLKYILYLHLKFIRELPPSQLKCSFHILFGRRGPWARSKQHYGLNQSVKNSLRSARGKLRWLFLSTAILCATFLQRSSICSVKFRWLSNVTPSSFCKVTCWISLPLHAILRALPGIFLSKLLPVTSKTTTIGKLH